MALYHLEDGTLVNTEKAVEKWTEIRQNMFGDPRMYSSDFPTLYLSSTHRYYEVGRFTRDVARELNARASAAWLIRHRHGKALPAALHQYKAELAQEEAEKKQAEAELGE